MSPLSVSGHITPPDSWEGQATHGNTPPILLAKETASNSAANDIRYTDFIPLPFITVTNAQESA